MPFAVGHRIRVIGDRSKGTIRYIGKVEGSSGEWLGVEWDDPARGRHDGSIDGQRYFQCTVGGSGSLIRQKLCNPPSSLMEAVHLKYISSTEPTDRFLIGKNSESRGEFKIPVSFVGEESVASHLAQLEKLSCISVKGMNVQFIDANCLSIFQSLIELDLEDNLLTDWEIVCPILANVVELRLGMNNMDPRIPRSLFKDSSEVSSRLRKLMLNSVSNAWHHVCDLAEHGYLSSLKELYLGDNQIQRLPDIPVSGLQQLTLLDLTGNLISDWKMLTGLSSLVTLSNLILDKNHLDNISECDSDIFPGLTSLSLFGNCISAIDGFTGLQRIPSLKYLRVQKNPVEDLMGSRLLRSLLIGLLPNLATLNRSEISMRERKNSEFEFLCFCQSPSKAWHRSSRHLFLLEKHESNLDDHSSKKTLSADQPFMLSVKIRSNLAASMTMAPLVRNVLQSMALDLVVQLARRYFKIPPADALDLYYHDPDSGFPILLDEWSKSLEFFGVRSGGEIIVESKGEPVSN